MVIKVSRELRRRKGALADPTNHDAVRGDEDQQVHGGHGSGVGQVVTDGVWSEGGAWRRKERTGAGVGAVVTAIVSEGDPHIKRGVHERVAWGDETTDGRVDAGAGDGGGRRRREKVGRADGETGDRGRRESDQWEDGEWRRPMGGGGRAGRE
jgi:hypothetical protein